MSSITMSDTLIIFLSVYLMGGGRGLPLNITCASARILAMLCVLDKKPGSPPLDTPLNSICLCQAVQCTFFVARANWGKSHNLWLGLGNSLENGNFLFICLYDNHFLTLNLGIDYLNPIILIFLSELLKKNWY